MKLMESEELELEKQKVEALIDFQGVGYWCLDLRTQEIYLSDLFLDSLNPEELTFDRKLDTFLSWLSAADRESFKVALSYHLNDGIPFEMTTVFHLTDKPVKSYEAKGRAVRAADGNPVYFIGTFTGNGLGKDSDDMDFQSLLADHQKFLLHSAKMSALGEMASGMAHEINNPLTIIKGKAGTLIRLLQKEGFSVERALEDLKKIESAAERTAKIIKGLKNFSRDGGQDPFQSNSVLTVIDETLSFCQEKIKANNIKLELSSISPEITFDCRATEISQVILNLISNAADAIAQLPNPWIKVDVIDSKDSISISITDCGNGIPKEIAEKMMQPFFTTKAVGQGTGLGLSISKGIIESHNGQLRIDDSSPNTCFLITLPKRYNPII